MVLLIMRVIRLPFLALHPHQVIPTHTAYFLEISKNGLDTVDLRSQANSSLSELLIPNNLKNDFAILELVLKDQVNLFREQNATITVNPSKTEGIDLLFILDNTRGLQLNDLISQMEGWQARKYQFKNRELMTVKNGDRAFSIAHFRNLLIFAEHAYLVENAISQLKRPNQSICSNKRFRSFYKRSIEGGENLRAYINLNNINAQFAPLLNAAKFNQLKQLGSIGKWVHFSVPFAQQTNDWKGSILPHPSSPVPTLSGGASTHLDEKIWQTIPDNLVGIMAFKLNGNQNLFTANFFDGQLGNDIAIAFESTMENTGSELLLIGSLKDGNKVEKLLNQQTLEQQITDYQMFRIWKLNEQVVPPVFSKDELYATIIENYLLLGKNEATLQKWLGKYLAGQTLSNNISFLQLKADLPTGHDGILFMDGSKGWQQIAPFFNEEFLNSLDRNPLPFNKTVASIVWKNGIGEIQFAASQNETKENPSANILWNAPLQNPAKLKPLVTTNPKNGEKEIFALDEKNRIYLISRSGRILWQRQINEPVISAIIPVDLNKNKQRQFVFSTASAIYVVDQKGNDLDGFPLKLQVPATNGVAVVDFFQSNDYSFFVACENGKAYGFDEKGSPVEGWRPNENIGWVEHPIVHFQADGKDFMSLLDVDGTLRVFKKNGTSRFNSISFEQPGLTPPDFQVSKKSSRIVTANSAGRVFISNLSGDHFGLQLTGGKSNATGFLFADVIGDNRKDYMALSKNKISINYYKNNKFIKGDLIDYPWPQDEIFEVTWLRSRKSFIGSLNRNKNLIFLMEGSGRIPDQFPLAGSTSFVIEDLLGDGKPIVITGNKTSITAYSLE
ncbi:MAG: hypothetical protein AAFZ15_28480 [Bacteroidota bacterium]